MMYLWAIKQMIYTMLIASVIGAATTNTNTEYKTGIISRLERKIEQKCHWNVIKFVYFKYYNKF